MSRPADAPRVGLHRVLGPRQGPFALLRRASSAPTPAVTAPDRVELLLGDVVGVSRLADIPLPEAPRPGPGHDVLAVVPFRQVSERGFDCRDDASPILVLSVTEQAVLDADEVIRGIENVPVELTDARFDIDDESYEEIVRNVLAGEIGYGEGANFVVRRAFTAAVPGWSVRTALAVYRRLLLAETGAYWTFLVHTGSRTFIGASPERQVSVNGGTVVMNPISGTYRYPEGGPTLGGLLEFLADHKETDELYMVVDEELKMMARACDAGIRVSGPYVKEMSRLAHTEYFIEGRSDLDVRDVFRETMFAPTVTGSPVENACRVIARHETDTRGYYSGSIALIGRDECGRRSLDSAILIRTAEIDEAGRARIGVGATLVQESVPAAEAAETRAKAAGVLAALGVVDPVAPAASTAPGARLGLHPAVRAALRRRNARISGYWLDGPDPSVRSAPELAGRDVLIVDAEDRFTAMLERMLRAMGLAVTVAGFADECEPGDHDLVVIGPGPGDPRDDLHPKIAAMQRLTLDALHRDVPLLSVCLGHQVLARLFGFPIRRKDVPHQGTQREVDLFGRSELVGFYNSFTAFSEHDQVHCLGLSGPIDVSRDRRTGEVHALRGPGFASVQFHPESVLTRNGSSIIAELVSTCLAAPVARLSPALRWG